MANWIWRVVHQFVARRYGPGLSRNSCLNYLHRLGFVLKRPKKRLVKAEERKRESFVAEYADLADGARRFGATIFFADEAHFRADAELRGKWVLKGEATLVDPSSPRDGEKASYYSAVCLETGEVERMELEGNSNAETSAAFRRQLMERPVEPLNVIWDNSPAHRGDTRRAHLATPELRLRPVNPRCHEGRHCPAIARTSTLMKPFGAGCAKRWPPTCAWAPRLRCRTRWATCSPAWPIVGKKSSGYAGPCSKHERKN